MKNIEEGEKRSGRRTWDRKCASRGEEEEGEK